MEEGGLIMITSPEKPPRRPILRFHGGKFRLAPWIIKHFPEHRCYVEPFGGAASILMQKSRTYAEIYNDLDSEIVNVFRVLRDRETAAELQRSIILTPFAREEFEEAYEASEDPVEQARRTILKSFAGFGSDGIFRKNCEKWTHSSRWIPKGGFRVKSTKSGSTAASDWVSYAPEIMNFCERLQGVVIDHRDALEVINQHDYPDALVYADPPYVHSSRTTKHGYRHEMDDNQHRELAEVLNAFKGFVVLSGYQSDLYSELYKGWYTTTISARSDKAMLRTECLWLSPRTADALQLQLSF